MTSLSNDSQMKNPNKLRPMCVSPHFHCVWYILDYSPARLIYDVIEFLLISGRIKFVTFIQSQRWKTKEFLLNIKGGQWIHAERR